MPAYVLLSNISSKTQKDIIQNPSHLLGIRQRLEEYEANILHDFHVLGRFNHCTIFEVSDNVRAQKAALQQELTKASDSVLMPAIDLDLFTEMVKKEIRTEGPHEWQVSWWAKLARVSMRWYQYSRWMWKYGDPFIRTGIENFKGVPSPCIVVANHTSHMDALALFHGLPQRIKWNIYFGAAADRWFLKDGGGRSDLALQPWYNSLIGGSFPIRRGGGSATLDYSKWLLDQGANLAIFPEGTRSTSKRMARFKHGVSLLALEKKIPVVPCYLVGLNKLRPKGTREVQPGPVSVNYQPAIHFPDNITVPEATQMIYDSLNSVHQRFLEHGPAAARWDWTPPEGE